MKLGAAANDQIEIRGSYATGAIRGTGQIGGLIGWLGDTEEDYINIANNYAIVDITTEGIQAGGLIGYLPLYPDEGYSFTIKNNYSAGQIITDFDSGEYQEWWDDYVNGLMGWWDYTPEPDPGYVEHSYYDTDVSGEDGGGLMTGYYGFPRSTSDMTYPHNDTNTYLGWDFAEVWGIDSGINDGYPYLLWQLE